MAVSFKCPNCAANLVFNADKQKMTCEYCGKEIDLRDIALQAPVLSDEAMEKEDIQDARIRKPSDSKTGFAAAEPTAAESAAVTAAAVPVAAATAGSKAAVPEAAESAAPEAAAVTAAAEDTKSPGWENESVQYVCNSCGAAVITDQNTAATFCAFCGSPTIIAERLVEERSPDYVLPFQFGREAAIHGFFEWCKAGRFTPVQFVKKENVEKMTGLYVPFWLFDSEAEMNISCEGRRVSSSTTGRSTYTTTSYYRVVRSRHLDWNNIPLDGATRIDDKLMEVIEPYNYADLEPFDMKYLAGFFADKYDLSADKLTDRLVKRTKEYVDRIFKASVKSYSSVSKVADATKFAEPQVHYALMPIWMLNYKYLGRTYTFAMNGQTGKIAGEPPVSRVKLLVLALAVLPVAACICSLIGMLVLGGI